MFKNYNVLLITLTYLSLFGLGLTDNLRGTLFPEFLKTFDLTSSLGAYIFILTSCFSILASFTSHRWLQKTDVIKVWRWGILLMGFGALGFFLAPTFLLLLVGCASLGFGFGILAVTQNLLITNVATPAKKQRVLSGLHSMYGFASLLSPLLVRELVPHQIPWRFLFLLASSFIFLLYLSTFLLPKKNEAKFEVKNILPLATPKPSANGTLFLPIIIACYVSIELLISTRLTSYLIFYNKWTLAQASLYLTYFFIGLLMGRMAFTFFHPPISTKKMLLISLLGSLFLIVFGLQIDPIFLCLSGLLLAPFYPLAISLISEMYPHQVTSILSKTISFQSLFFIAMNFSVGYWTDLFGIASAMNAAFIFGGIAWIFLVKL